MEDWYKGKWELWDIGRNKNKAFITADDPTDFLGAVRPYLMSADIDFEYDSETNEGKIFVGGFRQVGKFKRLKEY